MVIRTDQNFIQAGMAGSLSPAGQYFVHGASPAMADLERTIADIAQTEIPVLIVGESGTGKEVVAIEIHRLSKRWNEPFVKCGCAGLTGDSFAARLQYPGNLPPDEAGADGSLFLDGLNHLDLSAQARLLNLLPDGNSSPPPGCRSVRVISSATRNLEEDMKSGRFREELYYRINGVYLRLPPLRERREDIPALLGFFFKKYASLFERPEPQISHSTMGVLMRHAWPGNIRELENVARKVVALGDEERAIHDLANEGAAKPLESAPAVVKASENGHAHSSPRSLKEAAREASRIAERAMILNQLERTRWNRKRAASELRISYKALLYKLKQLGLDGSAHSDEQ